MKGYIMNPDKKYVDIIVNGILNKGGHCPCRRNVDDTTFCPCDDFIENGVCKCNLFIKNDKVEEQKPEDKKDNKTN